MPSPLIHISRKQALTFAVFLVLYEFLTYIANDMIMPGMIHVVKAFHAPESSIATSLTMYILGGGSLQLVLGPLSDYYGRRPVMVIGALLFFSFTILIACSNSMSQFFVMRFFQGMGLCFISVIGYATIQEIFAEMDAIRIIAIMANVSVLAPLLGPLAGSLFMHYSSWRMVFLLIGSLSLVALWGIWRFMPESVGVMKRTGEYLPRASLKLADILNTYKQLFSHRLFMLSTVAYGLIGLPCVAWIAISPVMLVTQAKLSLIQYALWQIPVFGASIVGNIVLKRISYKNSLRKIIILGSLLCVLSLISIWFAGMVMGDDYLWYMPGLILYFFALGLVCAPLDRFILYSTPISKGTASAVISIVVTLIQALGIEILNVLYSTYHGAFAVYCALIGILYALFLIGAWSGVAKQNFTLARSLT